MVKAKAIIAGCVSSFKWGIEEERAPARWSGHKMPMRPWRPLMRLRRSVPAPVVAKELSKRLDDVCVSATDRHATAHSTGRCDP